MKAALLIVTSALLAGCSGALGTRPARATPPMPSGLATEDAGAVRAESIAEPATPSDIEDYAFDWDPHVPGQLDLLIQSRKLRSDAVLRRATHFRLQGIDVPGRWLPVQADGLLLYRWEQLSPQQARGGALVTLQSTDEAGTGAELASPIRWLVPSDRLPVTFPKPEGTPPPRISAELSYPIARFLAPGPACDNQGCAIEQMDGRTFVSAPKDALTRLPTPSELVLSAAEVRTRKAGSLSKVSLKLDLSINACTYALRQLTRLESGLNDAVVLFGLHSAEPASQCAAHNFDVAVLRAGSTEPVARGVAVRVGNVLKVTLTTLLPAATAHQQYAITLSYPGGQAVQLVDAAARLVASPSSNPTADVQLLVDVHNPDNRPEGSNLQAPALSNKLAVGRDNFIILNNISSPTGWLVEVSDKKASFPGCGGGNDKLEALSQPGVPQRAYCVRPPEQTAYPLKLRLRRRSKAEDLLVDGAAVADIAALPEELVWGWVDLDTAFTASYQWIAADLSERLALVCGVGKHRRGIDVTSHGRPTAIRYEAFDHCELRFKLRQEEDGSAQDSLKRFHAHFGPQRIAIKAGVVPSDDSNPTLQNLRSTALDANMTAHHNGYVVLASQLRLREALGDVEEHEVIELEFTQDSNFYASAERAALSDTALKLRLRRAPQYGAWMRNRRQVLRAGTGGRTYFTVTTAPGTIFRYPHSGHGATTSSSVKELELATVGIGVLSVWELWDFDRDEPLIPWINPQLQFGLLGTLPTTSDKSIPAGSFVCGLGIRTGLATRPNGSGPESNFKLIMWYEALFDHERRHTFSNNLLFGFAVDLGTILN